MMTGALKATFIQLVKNYTDDAGLISELWAEIETGYSGNQRHYHTLQHLDHLLSQLTEIKTAIHHQEVVLFTLYYHDIIYDPLKSDNEEKSAELAGKRLEQISVPGDVREACKRQILATKSHLISTDSDTNYFTDADLSVLGESWDTYSQYYKNIRAEYSAYPDIIYNPGRKKVLQHFLSMERIFKTDFFYDRLEAQARSNLQKETALL